ncbi:hypothetical protein [Sodaliphilus pleomorphus]|nr:hypothetical protein [Sodaliphilus pleomorphus]MDD6688282.1 hypothetical protein [Sodaliphilus pleomorphus]MDY6259886.1 hypothetical protein [Bacteroidales bacterium]
MIYPISAIHTGAPGAAGAGILPAARSAGERCRPGGEAATLHL